MAVTVRSFDIIIVGGGPVGLSMAAALTRFAPEISLAVVDRRPFGVPKDARASAISAGVTRIFEALGLWDAMKGEASPVRTMKITDSGEGDLSRPLFLRFDGDVVPGRPYAHLVPNKVIAQTLNDAVTGKAELIAPVEITGFSGEGPEATMSLADGDGLRAPLVIGADGVMSALRGMAGIEVTGHGYGQSAIVTTIKHELPHEETAYEHFRPAGPFASLPLPGNRSSLVWTERTEDAERLAQLPAEELAQKIEEVMGSSLGAVTVDDAVQVFPLRLQIAREMVGPRMALIGDAAHVVHPIAGQGLNLGLLDVAALAEVLVESLRLGEDIGAGDVLERYSRWRRFDTALMAMVTDGMNRLFSNDVAGVRALRDFGLGVVDRMPALKSAMIRQAAAAGPGGPRLTRGQAI